MYKMLSTVFCIILLFGYASTMHCAAYSGFLEDFTEIDASSVNISVSRSDTETENAFITNFDVSDSGRILVCLEKKSVNVYNSDGSFDYALNYTFHGSSIAFWHGEEIVFYTYRGNHFTFLGEDGTIRKVCDYSGDEADIIRDIRNRHYISYGNVSYETVKNNPLLHFSTNYYDALVRNNLSEQNIYAYDNSMSRLLTALGKVAAFSGLVMVGLILGHQNKKKYKDQ